MDGQLVESGAERVTFGGTEGVALLRQHPDSTALSAAWTYREEDMCVAMQCYLTRRRRRFPFLRAALGVVLALDLLLLGPALMLPLVAWFVVFWALMRLYMTRVYPRRLVRGERAFAGLHVWEFTEDGVLMTRPDAEARLGWAAIAQVWEAREGFLVFPQNNHFSYLPKRAFTTPEQIEAVRELCRRHTRFEGEMGRS